MFKSEILFTGYYGQKNTGDDAFVEVAAWGAEKFWDKADIRFLAKKSLLPKVSKPIKGYPFELRGTYSLQDERLLKNTKAFIYAGGSTIHSKLPENHIRYKAIQSKRNGSDLKFGGIGVSIGPFKTLKDEKAVISYLRQMDFLAVRDQTSFDFVSNIDNLPYKPVNAFDLAALLPEIYGVKKRKKNGVKKIIGVSVCPYESLQLGMDIAKEKERNNMLVELLKKIDESEDVDFRFFVINGHKRIGDWGLTKETISKVKPKNFEILNYTQETVKIWEAIAACDFVISTRLHAAIFACFSDTPFLLNEYHRKCGDFLDNVGYQNKYRIYNSEYDINKTVNLILQFINNNEYIFPMYKNEMAGKSLLNFTEIKF